MEQTCAIHLFSSDDDLMTRKTISAILARLLEIHWSPVDSSHGGPEMRISDVSFSLTLKDVEQTIEFPVIWDARFVSHLHEICRPTYIWVVYSLCFFCCLFITVTWWYVWCFEWASGNQEEVQACLVTLWLFIISCYSLYKTTLGLLCSWFENNPHFHKYSMDFHV